MSLADIAAVVLAGGRGTRLGSHGPKPLAPIGGRAMIERVLARLPASLSAVLISANDVAAFASLGLPVVADRNADRQGPLAGLDAAAGWLRARHSPVTHLLSLPGDTPFLPGDVTARMAARPGEQPRIARFASRWQPTVALWPLPMLEALADHLADAADLSLMRFIERSGPFEVVEFDASPDAPGGDPFFNVNTPQELAAARAFAGDQQA